VKVTSAPAVFMWRATTAAPPGNRSLKSCLTLNVGDLAVAPSTEQYE
jgi:hypothetical protein